MHRLGLKKIRIFFFVLLLNGAFLLVLSPNLVLAEHSTSTYSKPFNGTLSATEWNGLLYNSSNEIFGDFVNTWLPAKMNGPLGIGTSSPASGLEVNGPIKGTSFVGAMASTIGAENISSGYFGSNTGGGNYSFPGNVGIGTANPGTLLNLSNTSTPTIRLDGPQLGDGTTVAQIEARIPGPYWMSAIKFLQEGPSYGYQSGISFFTQNYPYQDAMYERMRISYTGNVGIGLTNPAYKLDVTGTGNFTQPVIVGTPTGDSHAVTKSYMDSAIATATSSLGTLAGLWSGTKNSNIWNGDAGAGNVGIGTTAPGSKLSVRSAGVDGTYQDIISGLYTNDVEKNSIQTAVSSIANWSGFRFQVSNGGGSANQTLAYQMNRDSHHFYISGNEKMTIDSSGNVGIGTTAPGDILHISKGTTDTLKIIADNTHSAGGLEYVFRMAGVDKAGISTNNTGILRFTANNSVANGGTPNMIINSSGNIGIGLTNPAYKLDVSGTGNFTQPIVVGTPTGNTHATTKSYVDSLIGGGSGSTVGYWAMNGTNINNSNSGNVGIGTTAPNAKLEVSGSATPGIFVTSTNYPTIYRTQLGTQAGAQGILVLGNNGANEIRFGTSAVGGAGSIYVNNTADYSAAVNGTLAMHFTSTGNVGIGTTGPNAKLHVMESALFTNSGTDSGYSYLGTKPILTVTTDGNGATMPAYASNAIFKVGIGGASTGNVTTEYFRVNMNGNVGIGTTGPAEKCKWDISIS